LTVPPPASRTPSPPTIPARSTRRNCAGSPPTCARSAARSRAPRRGAAATPGAVSPDFESDVEEDGLVRALHPDVETVDRLAGHRLTARYERLAARGRNRGQYRVRGVGRLVLEVDAGEGIHQHPAHQHDDIQVRGLSVADRARLDRPKTELEIRIGARADAAEAAKAG